MTKKIAIYVEGLTELAFVRQLLLEHYAYNWMDVRVECLNVGNKQISAELPDFGDQQTENYYIIYNSQSDKKVVSDIKNNYTRHISENFYRVIGLRDVYSEEYVELFEHKYNVSGIKEFIEGIKSTVDSISNKEDLQITFAIMEIESWMLGLTGVFQNVSPKLTQDFIRNNFSIGSTKDPEEEFVHPFKELGKIYDSVGLTYSKHWDNIKKFIFNITIKDFKELYDSSICNSFNIFVDTIFK